MSRMSFRMEKRRWKGEGSRRCRRFGKEGEALGRERGRGE